MKQTLELMQIFTIVISDPYRDISKVNSWVSSI